MGSFYHPYSHHVAPLLYRVEVEVLFYNYVITFTEDLVVSFMDVDVASLELLQDVENFSASFDVSFHFVVSFWANHSIPSGGGR